MSRSARNQGLPWNLARRWLCGLSAAVLTLTACAQEYLFEAQEKEYDWSRNFRIGALFGFNIKGSFKTSGTLDMSRYGAGQYDDGYVIPNPANPDNHWTPNWSYTSEDQYNPATRLLTMHRTTTFSASTSQSDSAGNTAYYGFDMAYGSRLWKSGNVRIGWELGFGLVPIKIEDHQELAGTSDRVAYTFTVPDPVAQIMPQPGHHGTGSDGEPSIVETPSDPAPADSQDATLSTTNKLEVNLFSLRLGPTFYWDMTPNFGLSAGVSAVVGYVNGNYQYSESLSYSDQVMKGKIDMSEVVFGASISACLLYHAEDNGDIYVGVQYMPMGSATADENGHSATLDLSGQIYLTAGINWVF